MSRLRLGFPLLVAILLLLLLTFAPDWLWPRTTEGESALPYVTELPLTTPKKAQTTSPLPTVALVQSPVQSPLPTPLSSPTGYANVDSTNNPRHARISFSFDQPMDRQSVAWALRIWPPIPTIRTWVENTLIIEPSKPMLPGAQYTYQLTTDATSINGVRLADDLRYDYWVPPLVFNVVMPRRNAAGEPLSIAFTYPLYGESVLEALRIEPAIPGDIEWDLKNKQILLYPDSPLLANRTYTVSFVGELLDSDGQTMRPISSRTFVTPPPFIAAGYGMALHPALPLRLTFDRAMDASTTEAALAFSPPVSVTHGWVDNTLILTPSAGSFAANAYYQITLQPTATSMDGAPVMTNPYATGVLMKEASALGGFGFGPNIQVLLADGPRTLQYNAMAVEVAHKFELYALTPTQFMARYADGYTQMGDNPLPPIPVENAQPVAMWQEVGKNAPEFGGMNIRHETTLPADVPPGLYLLNMHIGTTPSQIFLVLTHHTAVIKQSATEVMAWLTDSGGKPTVGAKASIYAQDGSLLSTATSDAQGLLRTALARDVAPLLLLAEVGDEATGGEVTVAGLDGAWRSRASAWGWGWSASAHTAEKAHAVHLYTDRPIYQPGQTLYYKAIIRNDDDARMTLPSQDTSVLVRLHDARNNVVRTFTQTPNAFGTLDGEFDLAEGAMVGEYRLEVEIEGELYDYRFQVQEYRKPDFTVAVHTDASVYAEHEDVTIAVDTQYLWGEPVANAQVKWRRFYMSPGWDGGLPQMLLLGAAEATYLTDAKGSASLTLPSSDFDNSQFGYPEGGSWGIEVTVEDQSRQSVSASTLVDRVDSSEPLHISAPDDPNAPDPPFLVTLDRATYLPGEEAKITIFSRFGGPALVTMERGQVRRTQLVELTPPMTSVTTTITAADAPNLFVTVNGWEAMAAITSPEAEQYAPDLSHPDAFLHSDSVELRVPMLDKSLLLKVTADQTHYAPRQNATFTLRVTDEAGKPVAAELSLALVDEAVFALANDTSGSIFDAFYFPRPHTVNAFDTMAPTRYFGGGRGGGGGGYEPRGLPRHDFRDTVAWLPTVVTGVDGVAKVTLTLPDNLTTWRLTVKATTGESTQVGEIFTTITVWQPLIVRPLLPRGLTAGDEAILSATLHNESDERQEATIWLEVTSSQLQLSALPTQTLTLSPGEMRVVGWPVTATAAGTVSVTISALATGTDGESTLHDGVTSALRINPLAIAERTTQVGQFDEQWETIITVPAGALPMSNLRIELNRSVAGSFVSGLEYLTGFPYGCVEQTMSRALPNAVVSRAFRLLAMDESILHPDLPGLVNAGVQRLYGFQHQDGGWGWWYDDVSHDYQTAWVIYGLAMTAQSGYEVDTTVMARGINWLMQNLNSMDARTKALAFYSVTLAAPLLPADIQQSGEIYFTQTPLESVREEGLALLEQMDTLDAFSLAALALALNAIAETDATETVMERLGLGITENEESAYWSLAEPDGHYEQKTMASSTRSTALALSALLQIDPDNPLLPKIARWLMDQRQSNGWGSTNETAFALVALTDYLLATTQTDEVSDFVVEVNGKQVASGTLDADHTTSHVVIPLAQLTAGGNQLRLRQAGGHSLYYKVSQDFSVGQASLQAVGSVGIRRHYEDVQTGEVLTTLRAGQLVRVVLWVELPSPGFYMLVEDSLPGGLEALNESLNTTSYIANMGEMPTQSTEFGYNYKEIYNDRVRFFITELNASSTFSYLARATHAGRFVALPTEAWAMYNMQVWGRSASQEVVVTERKEERIARRKASHETVVYVQTDRQIHGVDLPIGDWSSREITRLVCSVLLAYRALLPASPALP